MASLYLGQDVANKKWKKIDNSSYSGQTLRYGSLVNN